MEGCKDKVKEYEDSKKGSAHVVYSDQDRQAVQQLILSEKVSGTVEEWLPGYQTELAEVKRRRLEPVSPENMRDAVRKAVRLRMRLEPKKDGRRKGRLILQGFREPTSWDTTANDSPTASLSTIRTLLFMAGHACDVVSSIDSIPTS